jgi:hypothetical protein
MLQAKKLIQTLVRKPDQDIWQLAVFKIRQKKKLFFYLLLTVEYFKLIHKLTMALNAQLHAMKPKARALAQTSV